MIRKLTEFKVIGIKIVTLTTDGVTESEITFKYQGREKSDKQIIKQVVADHVIPTDSIVKIMSKEKETVEYTMEEETFITLATKTVLTDEVATESETEYLPLNSELEGVE